MKRRFRGGKVIMIVLLAVLCAALFGFIVMSLWNNILVSVLHVGVITFWQALGILLLSKILFGFGGFRGGWGHRGEGRFSRSKDMREKWMNMTPEERDQFKSQWKSRCRSWKDAETQVREKAAEE